MDDFVRRLPGLFGGRELGRRHPVGVEEGGGDGDVLRGAHETRARGEVGVHVGVERVLLLRGRRLAAAAPEVVVEGVRRLLHLHREGAEPRQSVLLRCLKLRNKISVSLESRKHRRQI